MIFSKPSILFITLFSCFCFSQNKKETFIKGNPLLGMFGIVNVGLEHQLNEKKTIQVDAIYSPWKSIHGNHGKALIISFEGRHYFNKAFNKWYIGGNIGGSTFNLTKWNYWNRNRYQKGFSYMLGATIGYTVRWKDRWIMDAHIGGGTTQSFYKGYAKNKETAEIYRYDGATNYNKSGEIIPYKIGVMIGYKL